MSFLEQVYDYKKKLMAIEPQKELLRDLDLFVLDNSLRETTVGQLRGHTLENKFKIYEEVKKVGYQHIIVEAFNHMTRLGEPFLRALKESGEDLSKLYCFTELAENLKDGVPSDDIPTGLLKMKEFGVGNPVVELDLVYYGINYDIFNVQKICSLLSARFKWIRENLRADANIFVNIRDIQNTFKKKPQRLFYVINYISSLPEDERPFGLAYEDMGGHFPEDMAIWTSCMRQEMKRCGWNNGHLILHCHQRFGFADQVVQDCLAHGATGIWAGVCQEGASMGHASSCVTIINLIRMGNKKVLKKFNCPKLREASRNVTEITTGCPPHPREIISGDRALDIVFTLDEAIVGKGKMDFCLADFVEQVRTIRINTLATSGMIVEKLLGYFGEDDSFTEEIGERMREIMLEDLHEGRKEEYDSEVGLSVLFDRAGGHLTSAMAKSIEKLKPKTLHMQQLMKQVKKEWNTWDIMDGSEDDCLEFTAFYNGYMAPYFSCYRCEDTRKALQAIDMDNDGSVHWNEFSLYLKWAANQYPEIETPDELIDTAFRKGIIPAMQDELLKHMPEGDESEETDESLEGI